MKPNELIVLLMVREGRTDELFQIHARDVLEKIVWTLCERGMLVAARPTAPLAGTLQVTDKGRIYLDAIGTVPLPVREWSMATITGD